MLLKNKGEAEWINCVEKEAVGARLLQKIKRGGRWELKDVKSALIEL